MPNHFRLLVAPAALVVALALAVVGCGRTTKSLTPVVTGPVTWTNTISHLIADRSEGTTPTGCTSCHHAGTTIPDWSSYANVAADSTDIIGRLSVATDKMRGFLKPGEPETIIAWLHAGAPEN